MTTRSSIKVNPLRLSITTYLPFTNISLFICKMLKTGLLFHEFRVFALFSVLACNVSIIPQICICCNIKNSVK